MLTLFAMVLAIGIVVDDAIVVVENAERIMSEKAGTARGDAQGHGPDRRRDHRHNLVLSAVFVPMAFFGGSTGAIYRQFAVTLVLTMGFSALMALTLTPACAQRVISTVRKGSAAFEGLLQLVQPQLRRDSARLPRAARRMLRQAGPLAAGVCGGDLCDGLAVHRLPGSFLPEEDRGYFSASSTSPGATASARWKCCRPWSNITWRSRRSNT